MVRPAVLFCLKDRNIALCLANTVLTSSTTAPINDFSEDSLNLEGFFGSSSIIDSFVICVYNIYGECSLIRIGCHGQKRQNFRPLLSMTNTSNNSNASTVATPTVNLENLLTRGNYRWVDRKLRSGSLPPEFLILGDEPRIFRYGGHNTRQQIGEMMAAEGYEHGMPADLLDYIAKGNQPSTPLTLALGGVTPIDKFGGFEALLVCTIPDNRYADLAKKSEHDAWDSEWSFIGVKKKASAPIA